MDEPKGWMTMDEDFPDGMIYLGISRNLPDGRRNIQRDFLKSSGIHARIHSKNATQPGFPGFIRSCAIAGFG
jgi:hypothetical protein